MLMEYILSRQTSGGNSTGGDTPYDDYDMDHTIGGLGATDGSSYGWDESGIPGSGEGTAGTNPHMTGNQHPRPLPPGPPGIMGSKPEEGWIDFPVSEALLPKRPPPPRPLPEPGPQGPRIYEDGTMPGPWDAPPGSRRPSIEEILSQLPEQHNLLGTPRGASAQRGNRAATPPRTGTLPNGRAFPGVGPNAPAATVRQNAALPAARRIVNAASQQKSWTPAPAFRAPSPRPAPALYNPPAAQARNTYNPPAAPALRAALSALTRRR
jgi:hypothetical protein